MSQHVDVTLKSKDMGGMITRSVYSVLSECFHCFSLVFRKNRVLQDGFHDSCIFNDFAKVTVKLNDGGEETITAKNIMSLGHDSGVGSLG